MYQVQVYEDGFGCHCSRFYRNDRDARRAFHKDFDAEEVHAIIFSTQGYRPVYEKPVGKKKFRRCV